MRALVREYGLPEKRIRAALRAGELGAIRIGAWIRLDREEFAGWVAAHRDGSHSVEDEQALGHGAECSGLRTSLVWRSPSHFIRSERENGMGKGDVRWVLDAEGEEILATFEETTNLPLEIQGALDDLSRRAARPRSDPRAVGRLLRRAPDHRLEPYEDFAAPRRRARQSFASDSPRPRRRLVRAQRRSVFTALCAGV